MTKLRRDVEYAYSYDYEEYGEGEEEAEGTSSSESSESMDGDGGDDESDEEVVESELLYVPEMLSEPLEIRVNVGQTVKLPCSATDSSEFVRMWKHRDRILFTGSVSISGDPRLMLDESDSASLLLRDVAPEDEGPYTCSIMVRSGEEVDITHTITVSTDVGFSVQPVVLLLVYYCFNEFHE